MRLAVALTALAALVLLPAPGAAAPCAVGTAVECHADAGACGADAYANVVTTTAVAVGADCGAGMTHCWFDYGVGQQLLPPQQPEVLCGV